MKYKVIVKNYIISIIGCLLFTLAIYIAGECVSNLLLQTVIIGIGTLVLLICMFFTIKNDYMNYEYECPYCEYRYKPDFKSYVLGINMGAKKRLKCPNCEMKGFNKRILR